MVAGTSWPHGDPFLQRQNEPSVAVSTRNPLHLLAGANDYRSVDIPFNTPASPDNEERGDAWVGVFKSRNGGQTWWSDLLPGYPQDASSTSPIHGFQAAADPVVRAGANGMFYYSGIVLNRDAHPLGAVFVSRFIDNNNTENGDPIALIDTQVIDKGTAGAFIDKPWIAVAPGTGQCTVNGQTFPAQNVYLAYTEFLGSGNNLHTKLMFARSTDCGATWSQATKLSEEQAISQGATFAVAPNGTVYVVWRRFQNTNQANAILVAKSADNGKTFTKASLVANINPFEQGMTYYSIRTNAYPAAAADSSNNLYVVWADRSFQPNGDGRIVITRSADGSSWTPPATVEGGPWRGNQFMPAITVAGGKVVVAYYDLRDDDTMGVFTPLGGGQYLENRDPVGDLPAHPELVFTQFLLDIAHHRRHTLDLRAAQAGTSVMPTTFDSFARVSRYVFGSRPGATLIEQLQYNPPNLPMFRGGTAPFIGDYIDLTGYASGNERVLHAVWTDNRDVRPPADGNWSNYTPPSTALTPTSKFNGQATQPCVTGQTGMRNQNIYTARITNGLFASSPGNSKQLLDKSNKPITRAFVVYVQNATSDRAGRTFRLTAEQPNPGWASFTQFAPYQQSVDVTIPPRSSIARTVFVNSTNAHATVNVDITEISGGVPVPNGLTATVVINPDVSNPDVSNPDVSNPDVSNPDVSNPDVSNPDVSNAEVHNPDVSNPSVLTPDVSNPDVSNPDVSNPDVSNPDVSNPDVSNPDVSNPDVSNPDVSNPDVSNPDVSNASVSDTTWTTHNKGNTTSGYNIKLASTTPVPNGVRTQLIINRIYQTPIARSCALGVENHRQIIANILDPVFTTFGNLQTADPNATLWLAPGDAARITLRVYNPTPTLTPFDPSTAVAPVVIAEAVNSQDAANGITTPPFAVPLVITTTTVNDAVAGQPYSTPMTATGGVGAYTFTVAPAGFTVINGVLSGTFANAGDQILTVTVADSAMPPHTTQKSFTVHVTGVPTFTVVGHLTYNGLPRTPTSQPQFFLRNEGTLQQQNATIVWNHDDTFTISGLPAGTFGVEVTSAEGNPSGVFYPGGFYSFTDFDSVTASDGGVTVNLLRIIHLTAPADNANPIDMFSACPSPLSVNAPSQIVWDAITDVPGVQYSYNIDLMTCPITLKQAHVVSGSTSTFAAAFNALPPTAPNDFYLLTLTASAQSGFVGEIMTVAASGSHGWDLRFTVPTSTAAKLPTVAAGNGQLEVFDVSGLATTDGASVHFADQNGTGADGFLFHSPSTPSRLYVRLPSGLANGALTATVTLNGNAVAATQITQSTTPGTPIIQAIRNMTTGDCTGTMDPNPTTTIFGGKGIAVSAFGTDTVGAEVQFTQNAVSTIVAASCAEDSASIGEAAIVGVPLNLSGSTDIAIRTTVNGVTSAWSKPVTVTVIPPVP